MEVTAHYGELFAPESMIYLDKHGRVVLEIHAPHEDFDIEPEMVVELDKLIRKYIKVIN